MAYVAVANGKFFPILSKSSTSKTSNGQPYPHRKNELPEISPILGSEKTQFYRNKLEYTFSNKRWLTEEEIKQNVVYEQMNAVGFHIPNAFDKVLAIEKCWLQDDISNRIRNTVRDYAYEHNYSFINLRTQEGHVAQHDHPHIYHRRINGYPHS